jgi:hypothetical protein
MMKFIICTRHQILLESSNQGRLWPTCGKYGENGKYNTKLDLKETGYESVDYIHLAQVNAVYENSRCLFRDSRNTWIQSVGKDS